MNMQRAIRWLKDLQFSNSCIVLPDVIRQCYTPNRRRCNRIFISKRKDVKKSPISSFRRFLARFNVHEVSDWCQMLMYTLQHGDTNTLKACDCWSMAEVADVYMYTLSREQRKGGCRYKIETTWSNLLYILVALPRNAFEYRHLLKQLSLTNW